MDLEELFGELDILYKLKSKICKEDNLKFGDEDSIEYKKLYSNFIRTYMPKTEDEFIDFIEDIQSYYEDLKISLKKEKGLKEELINDLKRLAERY